jgi:hypothetical protein
MYSRRARESIFAARGLSNSGEVEMGLFVKAASGVAAAILMGMVPSAANAQSASSGVRVIRVGCDSTQLPPAIATAIAQSPAVVRLAPHCTYVTTTTLNITSGNVTIDGASSTAIKGDPAMPPGPILNVASGATLDVEDISILGGRNPGNGGAIVDLGNLVLKNIALIGNESGSSGGALALESASARALISHTVIEANTALMNGGAFINRGILTLFHSRVSGNAVTIPTGPSGRGGAILTENGGNTRIIESTIDNNTSARLGGGITNASTGVTSLSNSLVEHNKASLAAPGTSGGGISNENPSGGVTLSRTAVRMNTPDNCGGTPVQGCQN